MHGWLELARPIVFVLTDGSGGSGRSRIESTHRVLSRAGASAANSIFGRLTDAELYESLLARDHSIFLEIADELAQELRTIGARIVAGDSIEGYNPGHDVCRLLIDCAVALINRDEPNRVSSFEFPLIGPPDCGSDGSEPSIRIELCDRALTRKLTAAREYHDLRFEVEAAIGRYGLEAFRHECLYATRSADGACAWNGAAPDYERHGETRIDSGKYARVLRYRTHVLPLVQALSGHVSKECA